MEDIEVLAASLLLTDLLEPCLLAVMRCLADDPVSLCTAARAHSRLHQAAVVALSTVKASIMTQQRTADSLLPYLRKHAQHVDSMRLRGDGSITVRPSILQQLPPNLHLTSLQLNGFSLRLGPIDGFQGVLGAAGRPLKQLRLRGCTLLGGVQGLAAALRLLPGLECLKIFCDSFVSQFPAGLWSELQQLTNLQLVSMRGQPHDPLQRPYLLPAMIGGVASLESLQALKHLADPVVMAAPHRNLPYRVTANALSGLCSLTRLVVRGGRGTFDPGALAGKTQLRHLDMRKRDFTPNGAAGVAQMLSQLQQLTQLTYLSLGGALFAVEDGNPPAAAYSALTASSQLQHLGISDCTLPGGVWQHVFPAGRQLPHLQSLNISAVKQVADDSYAAAPEGSRLISCCPGLQCLDMQMLQCNAEVLLQLTQLQHMTKLTYHTQGMNKVLTTQAPGDEPVWRRLLQLHLDDSNPVIAQQAAAALADQCHTTHTRHPARAG